MAQYKIAVDAGHGGSDYGATYNGRAEKDDNLKLALAVGDILEKNGIDVVYTRTTDEYETPFKKATDANDAKADYFVSIHRNSSPTPNQYTGVETLVYNNSGIKSQMAANINSELEKAGFKNLGITERPNLVVLKRTKMPAVLVEASFINNDKDNAKFDNDFDAIANAIAAGILTTIDYDTVSAVPVRTTGDVPDDPYAQFEEIKDEPDDVCDCSKLYRVQIGAFRNRENAERLLNSALADGFPAFIIYSDNLYKVQVGAFRNLDNAVRMERRLRRFRYNTFITT